MDLTEAEEIKKRWQEELYRRIVRQKILMTWISMMVWSFTYSLECEVKWALGSINRNKASGGDRIPAELFQILNDDVQVLHSLGQKIWKTQQWSQDWKRSVFILIPKKVKVKSLSRVQLLVTPWTVGDQASASMGFSRQEY